MRVLLLVAVIAFGTDALLYDGKYTQTAYREGAALVKRLAATAPAGQ